VLAAGGCIGNGCTAPLASAELYSLAPPATPTASTTPTHAPTPTATATATPLPPAWQLYLPLVLK
jgi:hypothetical protein